jgi:hypothetical protein
MNCAARNALIYVKRLILSIIPILIVCEVIAGFSSDEAFHDIEKMWQEPDTFSSFIVQTPFNNQG